MATADNSALPQPLREHLEALQDQKRKRMATHTSAVLKHFEPISKQLSEVVEAMGGPDPQTLAVMMEVMSNPVATGNSEFATAFRKYYEPIIEQAIASLGIDEGEFWKEFLRIIEIPEHEWKPGSLLTGKVGFKTVRH